MGIYIYTVNGKEYLWEYLGKYGNIYGWLVVAITNLEKYEFVNGKDDIPYM
jgi:hypothetical protein